MIIKYNADIEDETIKANIKRIINQVYKLLPMREEGADWQKPLSTLVEEVAGMNRLMIGKQTTLFTLLCKMEGLFELTEESDFMMYRRVIFECLGLLGEFEENVGN